jgi:hypothetical protein
MPNGKSKQGTGNAPASSPSTAPACVSTPKNPNPPCSQHSVVVEFRPLKDSPGKPGYKGEFGFDWLRIYEWGMMQNNPFTHAEEIPYIDAADGRRLGNVESGAKKISIEDIIAAKNITVNLTATEAKTKIQKEYNQFVIKRFPSKPQTVVDYRLLSYFVPYLNLFPEGTQPVTRTKPDASKPFLTLPAGTTLPNPPCEAALQLLIDIKYQTPHEIVLEYDPAYLQISGTTGSSKYYEIASSSSGRQSRHERGKTPKGASVVKSQYVINKFEITPENYAGNVKKSDEIKVKCIRAIPSDIRIFAYAYDKNGHKAIAAPVGEMVVCANDVAHQKRMKIALVQVDTDVQQDNFVEHGIFRSNELISLFHTLHQALILPDVVNSVKEKNTNKEIILDLTKDKKYHDPSTSVWWNPLTWLSGKHLFAGCINPHVDNFEKYLEERLNASYQAYHLPRDYFLVFNFGENGPTSPRGTLNGIASSKVLANNLMVCRSSVSLFPSRGPWTLPHELLHTLQLFHTHDDNPGNTPPTPLLPAQKYIFGHGQTTNVMSYNRTTRHTTWKWQWEIMRKNAANITR